MMNCPHVNRLRAESRRCRCREGKGGSASCPVIIAGHVTGDDRTRSSPVAVILAIFVAIVRNSEPRNLLIGRLCAILSVA